MEDALRSLNMVIEDELKTDPDHSIFKGMVNDLSKLPEAVDAADLTVQTKVLDVVNDLLELAEDLARGVTRTNNITRLANDLHELAEELAGVGESQSGVSVTKTKSSRLKRFTDMLSNQQQPTTTTPKTLKEAGEELTKAVDKKLELLGAAAQQQQQQQQQQQPDPEGLGLAFPLNLCFAFCSLFPKDDEIDVPRLIDLWIGERFVIPSFTNSPNTKDLEYERVGVEYFRKMSNIFQDVKEDDFGNPITCRMDPDKHGQAVSEARKLGYITVRPDGKVDTDNKVRHAAFDFRLDVSCVIPESLLSSKSLLTILLPAAKQCLLPNVKMTTSTAEKVFQKLRTLRVLDLHDLGMTSVPKSIGDLGDELRYLDLSRNNMEKLPTSITKLKCLQTLKLSHCRFLQELPKEMDALTKLRHLEIDGCLGLTHMPECIEKMTSLTRLTLFMAVKPAGIKGLANLNKLRGVLEIAHLGRCDESDAKKAKLEEKKDLQRLILRWDQDDDQAKQEFLKSLKLPEKLKALILMGYGGNTSYWHSSILSLNNSTSLVKLSLINCCKCESILPLDTNLPSLKILELRKLNSLKFIDNNNNISGGASRSQSNSTGYFPSLEELTISDCPNLESWWEKIPDGSSTTTTTTPPSSFSSISILSVQYCPKLKHMPMPLCEELNEKLEVISSSFALVLETVKKSSSPHDHPFSKLKSMLVSNINDETLPDDLFQNFTSLQHLHIRDCHPLKSLPQGFGCLNKLETLTISRIPKLKSLSNDDDSIGKLESLKKLDISDCINLEFLPKALKSLKLETLSIKGCPKLIPRVQRDTGDDWPQIQHIPNINV